MTDQDTATLDHTLLPEQIDIGRPVEWMVDPVRPGTVLGVTYEFSQSAARRTVWYTPNKRRPKKFTAVSELPKG